MTSLEIKIEKLGLEVQLLLDKYQLLKKAPVILDEGIVRFIPQVINSIEPDLGIAFLSVYYPLAVRSSPLIPVRLASRHPYMGISAYN